MTEQLLLALDQGTTGSTALVMDLSGRTLGRHNVEFEQHFPEPGWVEHEPEEIWASQVAAAEGALAAASVAGDRIGAIGVTNQRETTLLWDRATGRSVHRAIVWQDRRTSPVCAELKAAGHEPLVKERSGLVLDPYFSGTKVAWMLDHVEGARARAEAGELAFGTVDSFLIHRLSGGSAHVTDVTNASRTLLMNLESLGWDPELLALLRVPAAVLPTIVPSAGRVAETRGFGPLPDGVPIAGIAGDQQAALFGQACFGVGDAKCTYGTGAFVLTNVGGEPVPSRFGLLSTVAWQVGDEVTYALEGSAFIAGAAVQWLRDGLGLIDSAPAVEPLARQVESSDGVFFVPALAGLGAPYWDPDARGLICGMTRGTTAAHLARATLEAIAHEVTDLLESMSQDLNKPLGHLRVDGGAAANDLLMEQQAMLAGLTIDRPQDLETTARGAAMLAALGASLLPDKAAARKMAPLERSFDPPGATDERQRARDGWKQAVARARM
ncbi:MAG: glycerol kinase GlpK [Deltaproteobacteria bacterium]|jgi:glycerol kinase|nr:glycerol kinase GlpK [Deltaproteobacteria bacterium]MBW2535764.1 glycerol kinase GlpK [Deltaproteobacteria bacterium]